MDEQTTPEPAETPKARTKAAPTMVCHFCGHDKPIPAEPGRERYETDEDGEVIFNEFCPHCGKGEPVTA